MITNADRDAFALEGKRLAFENTRNPHYAWYAIHHCLKANAPFPKWLIAYLGQCSERMLSDNARQTADLRKALPWVFGFPRKRGPGNLLNPGGGPERLWFVMTFARLVLDGEDPMTARREACNGVFHGKDAEVDDKTLMRWLLKAFKLKEAPTSAKQWEEVAYSFLVAIFTGRAVRRSDTTTAEFEEITASIKQVLELFGRALDRFKDQIRTW